MSSRNSFALVMMCALLVGCVTGKSINSAEDIRDDGKSNVALLTHDIEVYVTDKHSSVKQTRLNFRCPQGNELLNAGCFNIILPYLGTKEIDGFGLHAFEFSGATAIKLKYDNYTLQSVEHKVVIDRVPETNCYFNKKTRKEKCTTRMQDKSDSHSARFPIPVSVTVSPGSGCYIGHLTMTMVNGEIRQFNLDIDTPLAEEKIVNMPDDVAAALLRTVNRSC